MALGLDHDDAPPQSGIGQKGCDIEDEFFRLN
jgi:hypothetical protein